jgi:hypothetical protein
MTTTFLTGFCDELVKQAAQPILQTVGKSGTMLGQKVQGAVSRAKNLSEKIGRRAARGAGLKKVVEKKASEDGGFYDEEDEEESEEGADEAGEMLRRIMAQYQQDGGYSEEPDAGADQPLYGGGKGLPAPVKPGLDKVRTAKAKPAKAKPPAPPPAKEPTPFNYNVNLDTTGITSAIGRMRAAKP